MELHYLNPMQNNGGRKSIIHQAVLYFLFAALVIVLNLVIQYIHMNFLSPWICTQVLWSFIQTFYCPEGGRVLAGSVLGVGIAYIVKFFLDKFVVFEKNNTNLKQTSKEFVKYFLFAILTTAINIGGQFFLYWAFSIDYIVAGFFSLTIGYFVKFILDRRYVFIEGNEAKNG